MEFKVLSVLEKYMDAEQFAAFKEKGVEFEKALNVDISKYITANTPKIDDVKTQAEQDVIKSLGIETVKTVDELKNHIKVVSDTTTDKDKALLDAQKQLDEIKAQYETEVATRTQLEQETKRQKELDIIGRLGVTDPDEKEFLHFKFNKQVSEEKDFNTVVEEYAKQNGVKTSAVFVKDEFSNSGNVVDIGAVWKEQRKKSR